MTKHGFGRGVAFVLTLTMALFAVAASTTTIAYPGSSTTFIVGLNNKGHGAGYAFVNGRTQAFLYVPGRSPSSFVPFNITGSQFTQVKNIGTDSDTILGNYQTLDGKVHAFLRNPKTGAITAYDRPAGLSGYTTTQTEFVSLNFNGVMCGNYTITSNTTHASIQKGFCIFP